MGYIRHNAIVVTADGNNLARERLNIAYKKAKELFGDLVSEIVDSPWNKHRSFFIAPDGSKEGWEPSNEFDLKRTEFADFLDSLAFEDGSNCIRFVDVAFDEIHQAEVVRTNRTMKVD